MSRSSKKQNVIDHIREARRKFDNNKTSSFQKMQSKVYEELLLENKQQSLQKERTYLQQIKELKKRLDTNQETLKLKEKLYKEELNKILERLEALQFEYSKLEKKHRTLLMKSFNTLVLVHKLTSSMSDETLKSKLQENCNCGKSSHENKNYSKKVQWNNRSSACLMDIKQNKNIKQSNKSNRSSKKENIKYSAIELFCGDDLNDDPVIDSSLDNKISCFRSINERFKLEEQDIHRKIGLLSPIRETREDTEEDSYIHSLS